jgi:hypothetical protein
LAEVASADLPLRRGGDAHCPAREHAL